MFSSDQKQYLAEGIDRLIRGLNHNHIDNNNVIFNLDAHGKNQSGNNVFGKVDQEDLINRNFGNPGPKIDFNRIRSESLTTQEKIEDSTKSFTHSRPEPTTSQPTKRAVSSKKETTYRYFVSYTFYYDQTDGVGDRISGGIADAVGDLVYKITSKTSLDFVKNLLKAQLKKINKDNNKDFPSPEIVIQNFILLGKFEVDEK